MTKRDQGPLWAADGVVVDESIVRFCRGDDQTLDHDLLGDDLRATRAHVRGLVAAEVLAPADGGQLVEALDTLIEEYAEGRFTLGSQDEDGHSAIERVLTERLGDVGKKVHTGRSRNDQVLVASRLWLKRQLLALSAEALGAAEVCLNRAAAHEHTPMPGYTHLQRAMPSTVGFWFAGQAECLLEDSAALAQAAGWLDRSPLGTAAGYGINLPLARDEVARELGFSDLVLNGLCAQNGRGRIEAHALSAVLCLMSSVRRIAWDLSLFVTAEFGFATLPARWCTGSSIMPNKKNPDVVELMRASFAEVAGAHQALLHAQALPSAYHRDLQVTKGPMMRGVHTARQVAGLLPGLLADVQFDEARLLAAHDGAMLATDVATDQARAGKSFRDAYRAVKEKLDDLAAAGPEAFAESVRVRVSPGAPGALGLDRLKARAESQRRGLTHG